VAIQYPRDLRSNAQAIAKDIRVVLPTGCTVPLDEVADIQLTQGATSIRTENAKLATYIFVDIRDRDLGGYVAAAQKAVAEHVQVWSCASPCPFRLDDFRTNFFIKPRRAARLRIVRRASSCW
jgi:Cu/Ag efflux pump CusA